MPDWRRAPDGPHYRDAAGDHYEVRGTIQAHSQTDARVELANLEGAGIYRGSTYYDVQGNVPNGFVRVLQVDVETLVEAPVGAYGLYQITAPCGYPTDRYQRRAVSEGEWVAWMEFARAEEPVDTYKDPVTGQPVWPCNPLGMPLSPPLTRPTVLVTACFQWLARFNNLLAAQVYHLPYMNKVNKLPFYGFAKHCLYCPGVIAEESNIPGGDTWDSHLFRLTAKLDYRPQIVSLGGVTFGGWDRVQPILGTHIWKWLPITEYWARIRIMTPLLNENGVPTGKGQPIEEPVPISRDGQTEIKLKDADGSWHPERIQYYAWYDLIEEIDFSSMLPRNAKAI